MARDRARRYADMASMAADLRAYLEGRVVRAYRTGALAELRKWVRRNRGAAAAIAVTLLGLAAVIFQQARSAQEARRHSQELDRNNASLSREVYYSHVSMAQSALATGDLLQARSLLESCPAEFRNWEWSYLSRMTDTSDRTLTQEATTMLALGWSPDGTMLAGVLAHRTPAIWNPRNGELLRTFEGPRGFVQGLHLSPDGEKLLCGSVDAYLWDVGTGELTRRLTFHEKGTFSIGFAMEGLRLITAGEDRRVVVSESTTGHLLLSFEEHEELVHAWCIAPDDRHVATGDRGGTVRLWDAATGEVRLTLEAHSDRVHGIAFSPDGSRMATGGWDRRVVIWDSETGEAIHELPPHHFKVYGVAWNPVDDTLATVENTVVRTWSTKTWKETGRLVGHTEQVGPPVLSPDGRWMATCSSDRTIKLWDLTRPGREHRLIIADGQLRDVAYSPDGGAVAIAVMDVGVEIWDARTHRRLDRFAREESTISVAWTPDGRHLAAGGWDGGLPVWDVETKEVIADLKGHPGRVEDLTFHDDGRRLATACIDGRIRLYDWRSEELLWSKHLHPGFATSVRFSEDSRWLVSSGHDRTTRVLDAKTGEVLWTQPTYGGVAEMSPDGLRVLIWGRNASKTEVGMWLWDWRSNELVWHVPHGGNPAFSRDGSRVLTVSTDGKLTVTEASTGRRIVFLESFESSFKLLEIAPNGTQVVTVGPNGNLRFWDASPWP